MVGRAYGQAMFLVLLFLRRNRAKTNVTFPRSSASSLTSKAAPRFLGHTLYVLWGGRSVSSPSLGGVVIMRGHSAKPSQPLSRPRRITSWGPITVPGRAEVSHYRCPGKYLTGAMPLHRAGPSYQYNRTSYNSRMIPNRSYRLSCKAAPESLV